MRCNDSRVDFALVVSVISARPRCFFVVTYKEIKRRIKCKFRAFAHLFKFFFVGKTDEEISLVCLTSDVPDNTTDRVDGWRTFRIEGVLDFSLIGILSEISKVLAENKIGIFVVSTYNTDYILVKRENLQKAQQALKATGYEVV